MPTHHIPSGLAPVIPQLILKDAKAFADFAVKAFGAEIGSIMPGPDGKGVMHGFLKIGGAPIFFADTGSGFSAPTAANIMLYVTDVDRVFERATAAGAKATTPPSDMFWGDRWGVMTDPFGTTWQVATHKEDVSPQEMQKRMAALPRR